MGVYDYVVVEGKQETKEGQVKCWDSTMARITVGDKVPNVSGENTYLIAMREGGYLVVFKNTLISWDDEIPENEEFKFPIFDKWGMKHDPESPTTENGLTPNERYTY